MMRQDSQNLLEKEKQRWKTQASQFQTLNIYSKEIYVFLWLIHIVVQ